MDSKTARSIMRRPEVALRRLMTIDKVSDHLTKHALPGAPVVNKAGELTMNASKVNVMPIVEAGKLVGAVSRGDIMRELVKEMDDHKVPV